MAEPAEPTPLEWPGSESWAEEILQEPEEPEDLAEKK